MTVEVDDDLTGEEPDWMKLIDTRVDLPRKGYLGISAMTGKEYSDHHDISSFEFVEYERIILSFFPSNYSK